MDELKNLMKEALATTFAFYLKVQNYHWNVEGANFYEYHKMFQKIYEDVYGAIDPMAEQIRALGSYAPASFSRFTELSKISDETKIPASNVMVERLIADNQTVIDLLNKVAEEATKQNQQGLLNFIADRIDQHQKWSWFLKASASK